MPNPLAIGVNLGGLFLNIVAPRPKPRAGFEHRTSSPVPAVPRTPWRDRGEEQEVRPIAGGSPAVACTHFVPV
jgi:hypothetical protein